MTRMVLKLTLQERRNSPGPTHEWSHPSPPALHLHPFPTQQTTNTNSERHESHTISLLSTFKQSRSTSGATAAIQLPQTQQSTHNGHYIYTPLHNPHWRRHHRCQIWHYASTTSTPSSTPSWWPPHPRPPMRRSRRHPWIWLLASHSQTPLNPCPTDPPKETGLAATLSNSRPTSLWPCGHQSHGRCPQRHLRTSLQQVLGTNLAYRRQHTPYTT